ncbi:hypothetical protein llap_22226 [Limosa lapponica baueri]|uniref:Uncharacterized protein n=1 Tax=Limosa lapponica baueri TaxID=1758121 RepID=A0A2I0T0Y7_LIMLA|nr:hypothetical protein llap_22226 [Limosa lapponica baueri]
MVKRLKHGALRGCLISETLRQAEGKPADPLQALALPARGNPLLLGWEDTEAEGQGLWQAGPAERACQPSCGGEHQPENLPALHLGEGLPAGGLLLGLHSHRWRLHQIQILQTAPH